jgi:hypothetical protein
MVSMGGGPTVPASKEKGKPEKVCEKSIRDLKDEFGDVEVQFFHSRYENGKMEGVDVPKGM